jgi:CubicO group peptidase (beta-lactamase class C family)
MRIFATRRGLGFLLVLACVSACEGLRSVSAHAAPAPKTCDAALAQVRQDFQKVYGPAQASFRVEQGGKLIFSADLNGADSRTRFLLGSITKPMAAIVTLMHASRGELKLDRRILQDLPTDFQNDARAADPRWETITLAQVLNHSAGIVDYLNASSMPDGYLSKKRSAVEILRSVPAQLAFKPSEKLRYSNTGYYIVGRVLERQLARDFADLLHEEVIRPLQLQDTGVLREQAMDVLGDSSIYLENMMAVGNAYSTSHDLIRWLKALDDESLLSDDWKKRMWSQLSECGGDSCQNYGLGFSLRSKWVQGQDLVAHEGHLRNVSALVAKVPALKLNLAIVSNAPGIYGGFARARDWFNGLAEAGCLSSVLP